MCVVCKYESDIRLASIPHKKTNAREFVFEMIRESDLWNCWNEQFKCVYVVNSKFIRERCQSNGNLPSFFFHFCFAFNILSSYKRYIIALIAVEETWFFDIDILFNKRISTMENHTNALQLFPNSKKLNAHKNVPEESDSGENGQ